MSRKLKLPSGAELEIWISPFEDAKALYQALLEEAKGLKLNPKDEVDVNFYKDLFCVGFSSKKIEACIAKCFAKCTYNGARISNDTFEPVDNRQDYMVACFEVAQDNVAPFTKDLYAKLQGLMSVIMPNIQA